MTGALAGHRVIVFLQENKTTDFYFPTLAAWGAAVANNANLSTAPPNFDQPHDRNAWVHYAMGDYPAQEIDSSWHSHGTIPKTIIDLLGLLPLWVYWARPCAIAMSGTTAPAPSSNSRRPWTASSCTASTCCDGTNRTV